MHINIQIIMIRIELFILSGLYLTQTRFCVIMTNEKNVFQHDAKITHQIIMVRLGYVIIIVLFYIAAVFINILN